MSGPEAAAVLATAVVYVDGSRKGSAVLVSGQYMVTAAHVLGTRPDAAVEVLLPAVTPPSGDEARIRAKRVVPPKENLWLDAAVLDLGEQPPTWLPAPVPLSSARRLPASVRVFGYPKADALAGVWRTFDIAGVTAAGTVQLDWVRQAGTLVGHSGGPVLDPAGSLAGVLVEGSKEGQFDRFVAASLIVDTWPVLPRPWMLSGSEAGADHFRARAYGQRTDARRGDLFRGRHAALAAVRKWLTTEAAPGRPLVVTGQPGAGKSSVVARAVLDLQHDGVGPGLAFHARAATPEQLLRAISDLTGAEAASTGALLTALRQLEGGPWLVVVDALDEVATVTARRAMVELLVGLAGLPRLRVVVATRPLTHGTEQDRYRRGGLLHELGVNSADSLNLVDLDRDRYFDLADLVNYAMAQLRQIGVDAPVSRAAWAAYRADERLSRRLAIAVAKRAKRNYLVAALATDELASRVDPVDPDQPGFDPGTIPASVGEAVDKYLDGLTDQDPAWAEQVRGLLTALAYARGAGINNHLWLDFAAALGYPAGVNDVQRLRRTPAADYLLQTVPTHYGVPVTRLFHQALIDDLLRRRSSDGYLQVDDEQAILDRLRPAQGWDSADDYARSHAADHAAASGQLPVLLADPQYISVANLARLLLLLPTQPNQDLAGISAVLRQAAPRAAALPPHRRARMLALTAAHHGLADLHRRLAPLSRPITPRWAHTLGPPHQVLRGHDAPVVAVTVGRVGDEDVIVSAGYDGTVRRWEAVSGRPIGEPLLGHHGTVFAVALGRVGDEDVIVSAGQEGTVRRWEAVSGRPIGEPLLCGNAQEFAVALGRVGDEDVIVSAGQDGTVRRWEAVGGQPIGEPLLGHDGEVQAVAVCRVGEGDVIVSAGDDGTVRRWDAVSGQPIGEPLRGHHGAVLALAVCRIGEGDVIVSGGYDGTVRRWEAVSGQPVGEPLLGHLAVVAAVAVCRMGEGDVIVSAGLDGTVRRWEAVSGRPIGEPLGGYHGPVWAVAVGRVGDGDVIVSAGQDGTVRRWEAIRGQPIGEPVLGHNAQVLAVAVGRVREGDVIVSAGDDGTVRRWDVHTGRPMGEPLLGHGDAVLAVAVGRAGEGDVIVSAGLDGTVRRWDVRTGRPIGEPLQGHDQGIWAVALGRVGGEDVIVSAGLDGVRRWNAANGRPIGEPLRGHDAAAWAVAVAVGRIGGRDVIVSAGSDGRVGRWEAVSGQPIGEPLRGHRGAVRAVAVGHIGHRDVIVSAGDDGTVRRWDMHTGQQIGDPLHGHDAGVLAVAVGRVGSREVIVSAGEDGTARLWEATGAPVDVVDEVVGVAALALSLEAGLYVAAGPAIAAFDLSPLWDSV